MCNKYDAIIDAPFAALGIRLTNGMLSSIDFLSAGTTNSDARTLAAEAVKVQLLAYLQSAKTPLDFPITPSGTVFQQRVWRAMQGIPSGSTLTYAELAQRVGSGARAVANACGANPIPIVIPCHRVVARHGLGGFMGGREAHALSIKHWLLDHERNQSNAA